MSNFCKKHKKILLQALAFASVLLFLAIPIFASAIVPSSTQNALPLSSPPLKLYFLSLNKSSVCASVQSLAADYQALGAGGFVWKDEDCFRLLSSCYEKENDALLVQNSLRQGLNIESEVFPVAFDSLTINGDWDGQSKKVLARATNSFVDAYRGLFDIAISLDTSVYNEISARLAVNTIYTNFSSTLADLNTLFDGDVLVDFKNTLSQGLSVLEALCSGKTISANQTYSSLIKYRYIEMLQLYNQFLNK